MNDINNIRIGDLEQDSILFSGFESNYKFNFNDWTVTEGCDIDISKDGSRLTIKKFRANQIFLKSNEPKTDNITIGTLMSTGGTFDISGIDAYDKAHPFATFEHETRSAVKYYGYGLSFLPYVDRPDWNTTAPFSYLWPWDIGINNGELKNPNRRADIYGYVIPDGKWNLFSINEFSNIDRYDVYQMCFIIHDGNYAKGEIVDITANPIIIQQYKTSEDICSRECWRAYIGDQIAYNKNKTFENCWLKYGFVKPVSKEVIPGKPPYNYNEFNTSNTGALNPIVHNIVDLESHMRSSDGKWLVWRDTPATIEFWSPIVNWYKNNIISLKMLQSQLFTGSQLGGDLTLNIDERLSDGKTPDIFMFAEKAFANTKIKNLTINLQNNCRFSSGNKLFKDAADLQSLTWNGPAISGRDVSGIFEGCGQLYAYPPGLIKWDENRTTAGETIAYNNTSYAFNGASVLGEIPLIIAPGLSIIPGSNVRQMFTDCAQLTKIGPILDMALVDPCTTGVFKMFSGCKNLKTVSLTNLNHGTWRFDGTGSSDGPSETGVVVGNLSSLSQESVETLFNGLTDLTTHDPNKQKNNENPSKSFRKWTVSEGIDRELINLYIPDQLSTSGTTTTIARYTGKLTGMKIKITGLSGASIVCGAQVFNINNHTYTITDQLDPNGITKLQIQGKNNDSRTITIQIVDGVSSTNPHRNKAALYCPESWRSFIIKTNPDNQLIPPDRSLVKKAVAKGWSVYIGGKGPVIVESNTETQ